jgi:hypothetical protein
MLGLGLQPHPGKIYCYKTSRALEGGQDPHKVVAPIKKKKKKPYDKCHNVIEYTHDMPLGEIGCNRTD